MVANVMPCVKAFDKELMKVRATRAFGSSFNKLNCGWFEVSRMFTLAASTTASAWKTAKICHRSITNCVRRLPKKSRSTAVFSMTVRIHPTAIISSGAEIALDVAIGPFAVIEDKVRIGSGCILGPFVHLCGPLQLGERNQMLAGVVLGERPQHARYNDEPTSLVIGDDNIFGEQVTVNRGTAHSWVTRIGSHNHFMANSHIGHDCLVGDRCILAGGALVGGHCVLEDNAQLSANAGLHQFVRIGRLALLEAASHVTKDLPPFALAQGINTVCGINDGSMREAGVRELDIEAVRKAFHILYQEHNLLSFALEKIDRDLANNLLVRELTHFIRTSKRGVVFGKGHFDQK